MLCAYCWNNSINKSSRLFLFDMQFRKYLPYRRDNNFIQRCIQEETFVFYYSFIKSVSKVILNSHVEKLRNIGFIGTKMRFNVRRHKNLGFA